METAMMLSNALLVNRRLVLLFTAAILLAWASADALAHDEGSSQGQRDEAKSSVLGKLPADFAVYAVGSYRGTTDLPDIQLDDSGHTAGRADVVVNQPTRPVILVLTAYDPTVWRVGRTAKTTIAGIIVSGYHAQALIEIDKNTPHAISTHEKKGKFSYFYAYTASPELVAMNESVKSLVGKEIDRFIDQPLKGVFYVGDPPKPSEKVVYSDDLTIKDYVDPNRPLAGQKGLERLVKEGKLRLATQADIEAWVGKASEKYKRFNPGLRVSHDMDVGHTYVVLKELTLPNGLYGAHSRSFIVPEGVPFPKGPKCNNQFYFMNGTKQEP
jgi:hypothetical protein